MSDEVLLRLRDVSRVHGHGPVRVRALDRVDLTLRAGELVAIMGPSGSGKSTLLTIAGGLDAPSEGDVEVEGRSIVGASTGALARMRRRSVGYVFQDLNLIPTLTAAENVALPLELDGASRRVALRSARKSIDDLELGDLVDRFPDEMSGGQQQRIAIARALVGPRRVLLADEPTGALDSQTGEAVLRLLRRRIDRGAAGLLVTHDARHAAWADRIVHLRDGSVIDENRLQGLDSLLESGRHL